MKKIEAWRPMPVGGMGVLEPTSFGYDLGLTQEFDIRHSIQNYS